MIDNRDKEGGKNKQNNSDSRYIAAKKQRLQKRQKVFSLEQVVNKQPPVVRIPLEFPQKQWSVNYPGSTPLSIGYTSPIFSAEWDSLTRRP